MFYVYIVNLSLLGNSNLRQNGQIEIYHDQSSDRKDRRRLMVLFFFSMGLGRRGCDPLSPRSMGFSGENCFEFWLRTPFAHTSPPPDYSAE